MADTVKQWVGDDGELLIPIEDTADNTGMLLSTNTGKIYIAITEVAPGAIVAGNPMGLLLTLTYPATP